MSDAPASLQAALADRYRRERELGAGGMARVVDNPVDSPTSFIMN